MGQDYVLIRPIERGDPVPIATLDWKMKHINFPNAFKAVLATAAMLSASAGAAPIFSEGHASSQGAVGGASGAPLFSSMRLNGGQNSTVAFVSDDNSILIGHYARGPWSKAEFLRSWQNGGNNGNGNNGNGNGNNGNGNNGNGNNGNGNNGNGNNGNGNNGNGGGGPGDFLPPVETVTSLPEPSTFALLALGLLALGAMRRRQTNR